MSRRLLLHAMTALLLLLAVPAYALDGPPPAGATGDPRLFRHGLGVHNLLNWATLEPDDPGRYAWPPFQGPEHTLDERLIGQVRAAGFDFVRLTVDPGPFMQMTGRHRAELDGIVVAAIKRFRAHGLAVLLNLQSNSQVPQFREEAILEDPDSAAFASYVAVAARTAGVLGKLDDPGVGFEPVNEPPEGYDPATARRWRGMMETLFRAVRAAAPNLLTVVTGAQGGNKYALEDLDPTAFPGAMFSFHYYEPHILTHQGVEDSEPATQFWRDMRDLPYPPNDRDIAAVRAAVELRIAADPTIAADEKARAIAAARKGIAGYRGEHWGHAAIEQAFDSVAEWARRNAIDPQRILMGEFGAARIDPSTDRSRAAWLRDVRCAAASRHFAWSLWVLNGSSMGIADLGAPGGLDPVTLEALGLKGGNACPS